MKFEALQRQKEIFINGLSGKRPSVPVGFPALEQLAKSKMTPSAFAYVAGGAAMETTQQNNRTGFDAINILPMVLNDVSQRDTSTELLGLHLPSPILAAPIGVLELAHRHGDIAVAKAASALGIPMIFSNQASYSMEDCAAVMGASPRWFQLYWSKSNDLTISLLKRAEACGCKAIVLTLDTTMLGWRPRDLDLAYLPFLHGLGIAQYTSDPVFQSLINDSEFRAGIRNEGDFNLKKLVYLIRLVQRYKGGSFLGKLKTKIPMAAVRKFIEIYSRPSITWEELPFLKQHTKLPILLKGILRADDAQKAVDFGMDGIIVSNHGGRQVGGAISSIAALPAISTAVDATFPVLLDSGVRNGSDVFKALALGAKAVCIGRPYVYGLSIAGEAGVQEVFKNLMADFELTMGLSGCRSIQEINASMVDHYT